MGLLDFLGRRGERLPVARGVRPVMPVVRQITARPPEAPVTPESLRIKLFAAAASAAAGDEEKLTCLCQKHEDSIFEQGLIWTQVPPAIRANPALLRWYGSGLVAIAAFCAQRMGKPELMKKLPQLEVRPAPDARREIKKA